MKEQKVKFKIKHWKPQPAILHLRLDIVRKASFKGVVFLVFLWHK